MSKAYLLLYEAAGPSIWLAVKSPRSQFAPGAPALFGGTKDADASKKEKDSETLVRELSEESGNQIRLKKGAAIHQFCSADGGKANFYWTSDFTGEIQNFKPTKEVEDVLSVDVLHLRQHAAKPKDLTAHLLTLFATQGKGAEDFKKSYTAPIIHHWITKVFKPNDAHLMTTIPPYEWRDFGNVY